MSTPVKELQAQVLELPEEDRAKIAELLLASLEPPSSAQKAWAQLASRRRDDVRAGVVAMVPGDEAIARIRAKLA